MPGGGRKVLAVVTIFRVPTDVLKPYTVISRFVEEEKNGTDAVAVVMVVGGGWQQSWSRVAAGVGGAVVMVVLV